MANKTLRIYAAAAIIAIVVGYYVSSHMKPGVNIFSGLRGVTGDTAKFGIDFSRFAGAETLRKAQSKELIAEIKKVIEQNGLPADVFVDTSLENKDEENQRETNIAVTLHTLFHEYYDQKSQNKSLEKLWEKSPEGAWNIDQQTLDSVKTTLAELEPKRLAVRAMLNQPDTHFYYIFVYPKNLTNPYDVSTIVNTEASRYLIDYALLEEYTIAQALLDGNITEATEALAYIFRIAQLASHLGNVAVRSDAALVRLRAFDVMQRVVLDPKFDKARMIYLRNMLQEQHKHWTSERIAWFGDRASGIKLYHRVLMYGPDALEAEMLDELNKREIDIVHVFFPGFMKHHEADEVFYLRAMQQILDVSDEPFTKRRDVLSQITGELLQKENTFDEGIATEPFVANLLLKDVDRLMRHFARDKSALHRALALTSMSLGQSSTDLYRDFLTDEPYDVQRADGLLSITTATLPRPFRVPDFTEAK